MTPPGSDDLSVYGADGLSSVFARLMRASLLLDAVQRSSLTPFGLTFIDYSALCILENSGEPFRLAPSRMAELLVRTTGGTTRIVDRLETRGLVERVPGGSDRRSVLVGLTPDGHELCRSARAAYHERRAQIVAHMDPVDLEHINASIGLLVTA
ncbi:MAG: MarR family transcriptional regulator, partial [Aquihabitans sp.]